MVISLRENQLGFRQTTAVSLTSMTVGKKRFPLVHRLAANLSMVIKAFYRGA